MIAAMPIDAPVISLRKVSKVYEEAGRPHPVLSEVTLDLPAATFIAILGRSGSGKSTLLNLVAGIDVPTTGEIDVGGVCVTALSDRDRTLFRRHQIGFVYQFFNLIATLTVGENVRLPLELTGRTADADERARALLATVGLADRYDTFPDRLSGGEQQRVAIARALAADPPVLLADEPTGNLDADTGARILEMLTALTRDKGRTLLVATHSRAVAAAADLVLRVEGAHLVPVPGAALADVGL
jgi:putative ABC transport system ATP-binding protein